MINQENSEQSFTPDIVHCDLRTLCLGSIAAKMFERLLVKNGIIPAQNMDQLALESTVINLPVGQ